MTRKSPAGISSPPSFESTTAVRPKAWMGVTHRSSSSTAVGSSERSRPVGALLWFLVERLEASRR